MTPTDLYPKLKKISIRGRMAIALHSLQQVLTKLDLIKPPHDTFVKKMMADLASFTHTDQLDRWAKQSLSYVPFYLLKSESLTPQEEALKNTYSPFPAYVIQLIDLSIQLGRNHVGSCLPDEGNPSLDCLMDIFRLLQSNGYPLPDVSSFAHYSFAVENGWGSSIKPQAYLTDFMRS